MTKEEMEALILRELTRPILTVHGFSAGRLWPETEAPTSRGLTSRDIDLALARVGRAVVLRASEEIEVGSVVWGDITPPIILCHPDDEIVVRREIAEAKIKIIDWGKDEQ